ncbi:hypothetical protein T4A_6653 [Trichinella pseudospiralis]|uniref:Uncharacterized protein n=1 Tax=Trichinella pseudospiralis TaxID=6337 RepID=A0A0V1E711_TRIPS|nr:hypothetical protein T4A_6653 [Trichinella pseudospiralis]KRZ27235.1 hypothetical protein T4C_11453 [Trichinella pseudospiralis]
MQQCIAYLGNCWSVLTTQKGESDNVQKQAQPYCQQATRQQLEIPAHCRVTKTGRIVYGS